MNAAFSLYGGGAVVVYWFYGTREEAYDGTGTAFDRNALRSERAERI
jgi:hypothetical protein